MTKHSIIIQRHFRFHPMPTTGTLFLDGVPRMLTLEPPWVFNKPFNSCIPAGVYRTTTFNHPNTGLTLHVEDVPGRSEIIFHPGNSGDDTNGCILPAFAFSRQQGSKMFLRESTLAMGALESYLKEIKNPPSLSIIEP